MTVLRKNNKYVNVHLKPLALETAKGLPHVLYKLRCSTPVKKAGAKRFIKEAIHEGQFEKESCPYNGGEDISWEVTPDLIDYWVETSATMRSKGIEQHIYANHDEDGDQGVILDMYRDKNEAGKEALYFVLEFDDESTARGLDDVDVSIMADPDYEGFTYPIRHVCLTSEPVVQGLEKFKTVIAASLPTDPEPKKTGDYKMLKALAKKLGINVADDATDEDVSAAIAKAFAAMKDKPADGPPKIAASKLARDLKLFDDAEDDDDKAADAIRKALNPQKVTVAASSVRVQKDNRQLRLKALATGDAPVLTPACVQELENIFCDDGRVTLALSREDGEGIKDPDGFDAILLALSKNGPVVKSGEKTAVQLDPKDNPLVAQMGTEETAASAM